MFFKETFFPLTIIDSGVSLAVGAVNAGREEGIPSRNRAESKSVYLDHWDLGCSVKSTP